MLQSLHEVLPRTSSSHKVLRSLQKVLPSATLYYKACRKNVPEQLRAAKLAQGSRRGREGARGQPVLLRTTKLGQSTSQHYLYYRTCEKYFSVLIGIARPFPVLGARWQPVLLRTANLRQRTSQQYFVLQSLQNTSRYYFVLQSLQKPFPVLLRTSKLTDSTSQYKFVLQSLRKILPSTTLYCKAWRNQSEYCLPQSLQKVRPSTNLFCKACAKYFPVLLPQGAR